MPDPRFDPDDPLATFCDGVYAQNNGQANAYQRCPSVATFQKEETPPPPVEPKEPIKTFTQVLKGPGTFTDADFCPDTIIALSFQSIQGDTATVQASKGAAAPLPCRASLGFGHVVDPVTDTLCPQSGFTLTLGADDCAVVSGQAI